MVAATLAAPRTSKADGRAGRTGDPHGVAGACWGSPGWWDGMGMPWVEPQPCSRNHLRGWGGGRTHRPGAASLWPSGLGPPHQSWAVTISYQRKPQTAARNCPKSPKQGTHKPPRDEGICRHIRLAATPRAPPEPPSGDPPSVPSSFWCLQDSGSPTGSPWSPQTSRLPSEVSGWSLRLAARGASPANCEQRCLAVRNGTITCSG